MEALAFRQCTATARSGDRCGRRAIRGGTVCFVHGGASPQAQKRAAQQLLAMLDPAMDALYNAIHSSDPCPTCGREDNPALAVQAAKIVLDRTGFAPSLKVAIEHAEPEQDEIEQEKDIDFLTVQEIDRAIDIRRKLIDLVHEKNALNALARARRLAADVKVIDVTPVDGAQDSTSSVPQLRPGFIG